MTVPSLDNLHQHVTKECVHECADDHVRYNTDLDFAVGKKDELSSFVALPLHAVSPPLTPPPPNFSAERSISTWFSIVLDVVEFLAPNEQKIVVAQEKIICSLKHEDAQLACSMTHRRWVSNFSTLLF